MRWCRFILLFLLPMVNYCQNTDDKVICFVFRDKFNSEVKPCEIILIDNTGDVSKLDSSGCFHMNQNSDYSFILRVNDKRYYSFEKIYNAQDLYKNDTIWLENMERIAKLQIACKRPIFNIRQKKQIKSFLSNSIHGFHRVILSVGNTENKKKNRRVQQIIDLILYEQHCKQEFSNLDILIYYYLLPTDSYNAIFELEAFEF